jgi:primosomal protein N'
MNNETVIGKCWHCDAELQSADYGRECDCRGCGKPTRVCRNCRWYAPDRANQCKV